MQKQNPMKGDKNTSATIFQNKSDAHEMIMIEYQWWNILNARLRSFGQIHKNNITYVCIHIYICTWRTFMIFTLCIDTGIFLHDICESQLCSTSTVHWLIYTLVGITYARLALFLRFINKYAQQVLSTTWGQMHMSEWIHIYAVLGFRWFETTCRPTNQSTIRTVQRICMYVCMFVLTCIFYRYMCAWLCLCAHF